MSEKWLDELLASCYQQLLLYGIMLTGSKSEGEDLVQEAIYRFLLIYDKVVDDNYQAYLMRSMRNFYFDNYRKSLRKQQVLSKLTFEANNQIANPLTQLLKSREYENLYQKILHLPANLQEVLLGYYFLELSIKDLSYLTGKSTSNVKVLLHRGRKLLKKELQKDDQLS
ncbi:RNA polymerase sigma-70 factor (ECF subfamily) [Enterococcus sp. PF1-24]|uniref:RNA polymerase sigma factor n=1 Tax=unclassified Enterococcus TaxID=2608891 RepID=UPI00247312D8|nr:MULTISPECIES: sigma-70 family RNA polymerase sigma factor [unclassified Enterococcus]MDH6364098.1 RNA polymerase sigma-70 factor (ECF subfamily) [Enterococcus sp. PFB1-1]MDH6401199.1 RNA polymerase sigma-70 factor (ECF subfamily) [Enterococcus sp. PF1-24]